MTPFDHTYHKFTDFLQDKRFVHWKLFPTPESEAYWHDFLEQNPHLLSLFREAEAHFANIKIEPEQLSEVEKQQLWESIRKPESTVTASKKALIFSHKWIGFVVACAIVVLIVGLSLLLYNKPTEERPPYTKDLIVGNLLKEKDIQLIVGTKTFSFHNDVRVAVSQTGEMKVIRENEVERTVETTHAQPNKLITPYGKRTQLSLSDGSKVWLNSGSVLEFPAQFAGKNREIRLISGEMYIEVVPNKQKPFRVQTSSFTVNVFGTKFNLSTYANVPQSVILVEGSVSLQSRGKKEVHLLPGEQAIYEKDTDFDTRKVDDSQFTSWTKGYLTFHKTPVSEVLQQVARYYNLSFNIQSDSDLKDNVCTGKLSLSENLDDVMNTIARLSDTYYTRNNQTIYISSKKPME